MRRLMGWLTPLGFALLTSFAPATTACDDSTTGPSGSCCRICREGKPCGDTCIARENECRVGPGCACQG